MIISQTPVRLSLFGGNTDFREYFLARGGLFLTATIDKYIYCIIKKRFDGFLTVNYSEKETVTDASELKHDIVRSALQLVGIKNGLEISFMADIPTRGTGLGSSSAVAVGVLNALHTYLGEYVSSNDLAKEAVQIELDILKKPIGVQDQYAVAFGGLRTFEFIANTGEMKTKKIDIPESVREDFNNSLMLFYTGGDRKTEDVLASFNVSTNMDSLDRKKKLAEKAIAALTSYDLGEFGKLLGESWKGKKEANVKTTTRDIDWMYDKVLRAGALGGKVIGAGGGGFMLAMFPANKRASVRESLRDYKEMPFRFTDFGSKIILNI